MSRALAGLAAFGLLAPRAIAAPTCRVTISRAPSAVRTVVERWLARDEACGDPLDVQIEPHDGALLLVARDARGLVRQRVVPSADDAGLLIASWAAADDPEAEPPETRMERSLADPASAPRVHPALTAAPPAHWVSVGVFGSLASVAGTNEYGLRIGADFMRWHNGFGLGAAFSAHYAYAELGYAETTKIADFRGVVTASQTVRFGAHAHLRASLGVGAIYESGANYFSDTGKLDHVPFTANAPIGELSVLVGGDLGAWAIEAGPIAMMYLESKDQTPPVLQNNHVGDVALFAGIEHPL